MEENQKRQQKFLTVVVCAGEQDDILENMIFAESVSEKKQMLENFQEYENQVGRKRHLLPVMRYNNLKENI